MAAYRGSMKHKSRPSDGQKGTLCPEWTHRTPDHGLVDVLAHKWSETVAERLFASADVLSDEKRRYSTEEGIAFEAKPTNDGTWHGYPIPWEKVPDEIRNKWLSQGKVTRKQIKAYYSFSENDIHWAMRAGDL
ncbi:MAG: hypothetical protein JXQ84_00050 [Rhodospirillaceae bacterium]|nr:hypothetical protein [Rhodospirillaceae bacterium]